MDRSASTFSLIGERYLDTWHDPSHIQELEVELAAHGVVGVRRLMYEYLAASSLWWNVFAWEWVELDDRAVRAGWIMNAALFGALAAAAGHFRGIVAALVVAALAHLATLGLILRAGTNPKRSKDRDAA